MSVTVKLSCVECEATAEIERPEFKLTKIGTLRIQTYAKGWAVNGRGAFCPDHLPPDGGSFDPQKESWTDYDRRGVALLDGDPA